MNLPQNRKDELNLMDLGIWNLFGGIGLIVCGLIIIQENIWHGFALIAAGIALITNFFLFLKIISESFIVKKRQPINEVSK